VYTDIYKQWSDFLDVDRIALLGGEPLLHPKLHEIILDVRSWWPNSEIEITSNGLLVDRIKPTLQQSIIDNSITLYISIHNESWVEKIKNSIVKKFGKLTLLESQRTQPSGGHDVFNSESGNKVVFEYTYYFRPSALQPNKDNKLELHNSDPQMAHEVCDMKMSFHFWKGCLYKCGVMVTLPYMIKQKSSLLHISDGQLNLLNQYQPVTLDEIKNTPRAVDKLFDYIPQCEFCPSNYDGKQRKIFTE